MEKQSKPNDLSVIIVNYNVQGYLEQCLHSVKSAIEGLDIGVYVVDNASVDDSVLMIKEKFQWVRLIESESNLGFSKANNIAIRESDSEFVVLLNPDTIVEEDTFLKAISYLKANRDVGALGVKMIDGDGNYSQDSKKSFPSPKVAFYKLFGLAQLFPKSKEFGRYHLNHLSENENHEVDVLSGACIFLRKSVLDEVGLLDETFFMYGEDLDLCYRVQKAGYRLIYFSETTIIHYKGESTRKASFNYVRLFYKAMLIFVRKHFRGGKLAVLLVFIRIAIVIRALMTLVAIGVRRSVLKLLDFLLMFLGYYLFMRLWQNYSYDEGSYPLAYQLVHLPVYSFFIVCLLYYSGVYDQPRKWMKTLESVLVAVVFLLVSYALLPDDYHFSRMIIIGGALLGTLFLGVNRFLLYKLLKIDTSREGIYNDRLVLVGSSVEAERFEEVIEKGGIRSYVGFIDTTEKRVVTYENCLGGFENIEQLIVQNGVKEVVFGTRNLTMTEMIDTMMKLSRMHVNFRIVLPNTTALIGNRSTIVLNDLAIVQVNRLSRESVKAQKRLFDIVVSLFVVVFAPVLIWMMRSRKYVFVSAIRVLLGYDTWVNVSSTVNQYQDRKGVFTPCGGELESSDREEVELDYLQNYSVRKDLDIVLSNCFGRS